jgi:hypothetical protein
LVPLQQAELDVVVHEGSAARQAPYSFSAGNVLVTLPGDALQAIDRTTGGVSSNAVDNLFARSGRRNYT